MRPAPRHRSILAAGVAAVVAASAAHAKWTVTFLHPATDGDSQGNTVRAGQQGGRASVSGVYRAPLWSGTAASRIDLHPPGFSSSHVVAVHGGEQGGAANPQPNQGNRAALAYLLAAAGMAAGQTAMLNTLPTSGGESFNPDSWQTIRGPAAAGGPQVASGHLFTAQTGGQVSQIVTAFRHIEGDNDYTIQIRHGDANHVGAVIEERTIRGSGGPYPFAGAWGDTPTPAVLMAGQTYWVTLVGHGSAHGAWHLNTTGVAGEWSQSTDEGVTFLLVNGSQLPAIRIAPEGFPYCSTDWNWDGLVNSADIAAYLSTWIYSLNNGTLEADFINCGLINTQQISAFLTAWFAQIQPASGC